MAIDALVDLVVVLKTLYSNSFENDLLLRCRLKKLWVLLYILFFIFVY